MSAAEVFFATNRQPDPHAGGGFGDIPVAGGSPELTTYSVASVSGIDLDASGSGRIDGLANVAMGGFDAPTRARLQADPHDILVFIHGYANSFVDAITRAAFVKAWFAAPPGAPERTMMAFTWPSNGSVADYRSDQQRAAASGVALAYFLRFVAGVATARRARNAGLRVCLLAHSMGNHALQAAMSAWTAAGFDPDGVLFDEAIHAAADETADAYEKGPGGLGTMRRLARRISVYFSEADSAMHASFIANLGIRLGYDGPSHKDDPALYQPMIFRSVDCTAVRDYNPFAEALASHQYYRRSRVVRDDIAAVLDGRPVQNGISQLFSVG